MAKLAFENSIIIHSGSLPGCILLLLPLLFGKAVQTEQRAARRQRLQGLSGLPERVFLYDHDR